MACALLGTVSCESMLEIPQKGVVAFENFYASDKDAQAALTSMYVNYLSNVAGTAGIYNPEQSLLNYSADDILAAGGHKDDHPDFRIFCEFRYDSSSPALKNMYSNYVTAIYHANLVISNFTNENKAGTAPKWESEFTKQAVAEARVMRAYLHMMMALTWYNPPIIDRLQEGDDLPSNAENQAAILDWVVKQCQLAIESGSLPERKGQSDKDATARMSVGFAQFVAGKAAVFMGDWKTAREYLGELIADGNYDLVDGQDFWTNFHVAGDGNKEKIFEPNFLEDPAFTASDWGPGVPVIRSRWMVANVLNWGTGTLASLPQVNYGIQGWNGGAIQEDFAKKFLEHDGDSPRRLATFITAEEFLYEIDWASDFDEKGNKIELTLDQKKADPKRGIKDLAGLFSHGPYLEWKHMSYTNPPALLTGGKSYPADNVKSLGGGASNQKNFNVARFAEALLLYAEACYYGSAAEKAEGLKALNRVQQRSGSNKISSELTLQTIMEEKQYELWFETCRFHDLVRWSKQTDLVDLDQVYNKSGIHDGVPALFDEYFIEGTPGYGKEHKLFTKDTPIHEAVFVVNKHEYFPYPYEYTTINPNLQNTLGWASAQ